MRPAPTPATLEIGYVARTRGLLGQLAVNTFDPSSESLSQVGRVLVRPRNGPERWFGIEEASVTPREVWLKLEGVDGRAPAEALVGATVALAREDLPPLEEGELYLADLIGLEARDESGERIGRVEGVMTHGPVPNLIVRGPGDAELLIPYVQDFVPRVEEAEGFLVVRPLEYDDAP